MAAAPADFEAQTVAAMVALVRESVDRAQARIGMARVDELSALDGRACAWCAGISTWWASP